MEIIAQELPSKGGVTRIQYKMFDDLFSYYNKTLFNGKLPDCMISISKHEKYASLFIAKKWKNNITDEKSCIHEIILNPDYLGQKSIKWHLELVHCMGHLWQHENGKQSRRGYHNQEFAQLMETFGIIVSSTGKPGGKKTGDKMSQYILLDGKFTKIYNDLSDKQIRYVLAVLDGEISEKHTRSQTKYTCRCKNNVWGKPGLFLVCPYCKQNFLQKGSKELYKIYEIKEVV